MLVREHQDMTLVSMQTVTKNESAHPCETRMHFVARMAALSESACKLRVARAGNNDAGPRCGSHA